MCGMVDRQCLTPGCSVGLAAPEILPCRRACGCPRWSCQWKCAFYGQRTRVIACIPPARFHHKADNLFLLSLQIANCQLLCPGWLDDEPALIPDAGKAQRAMVDMDGTAHLQCMARGAQGLCRRLN